MMGQHTAEIDEESLQKTGRRCRSCLDVFLVTSIVFLFLAVAAVAAVVGMIVMESQRRPPEFLKQESTTDAPNFKGQNFVYLDAKSSELKTSTMLWASIPHGEGTSVGSNFVFNEVQNTLMPKRVGTYFMYINMNLTCTHKCSAGVLKVKVDNKLSCEIELPVVADSRTVTRQCWTVKKFNRESLLAQMTVPEEGLENWKLELSSGWGMFLVD